MPGFDHPAIQGFSLDAGHPALDLANTLNDRYSRNPEERLTGYRALADFALTCGFIDPDAHRRQLAAAVDRPHEAAAVLAAAIAVREAIYNVATALVDQGAPSANDLDVIARFAAAGRAAGRYVFEGEGFRWSWEASSGALERPVWQLADAAVSLFSHEDLSRLRRCAADDCAWLFLDETRNRSRKWCDMSTCGNRAKVARYRRRER